jgi:hypothetical protein
MSGVLLQQDLFAGPGEIRTHEGVGLVLPRA